jgi:anaerobic selenocysteine-containing dehydrogenase
MAVYYDAEAEGFAIAPDDCEGCGEPLYDTGCDAPGCLGRCCMQCGTGCDIEFVPEDGRCATALDDEGDEEYADRINAERAAFGLPALRGED